MAARKVRSDSKLDALAPEIQDALFVVVQRDGYQAGLDWLAKHHKRHASLSSLHAWYHRQAKERQRARFMRSRSNADAIVEAAGKIGTFNEALAADFQQRAFEIMLAVDDGNPVAAEAVKELVKLSLDLQGHQLDVEKVQQSREALELRVKQLEANQREAKQALTKASRDGALTKDTRDNLEQALNLL